MMMMMTMMVMMMMMILGASYRQIIVKFAMSNASYDDIICGGLKKRWKTNILRWRKLDDEELSNKHTRSDLM